MQIMIRSKDGATVLVVTAHRWKQGCREGLQG